MRSQVVWCSKGNRYANKSELWGTIPPGEQQPDQTNKIKNHELYMLK